MTAPTESADAAAATRRAADQLGATAAIAVIGGIVATAWWIGRELWFFSDDWNIFAGWHSGNLLEPFNGHLSLVPAGAYQALFHTLGVESYWPYRVVGLVGWIVLGTELFRYARVRTGDLVAVLATVAVMWSSAASTNVMFPFLVNYSLPIAAMIGAWRALDRDTTRGDVIAALWLALALGTSGLGLMTVGAVGVELLLRRAPLRRWATLSPGPILWLVWYLGHREATPITDDLGTAVRYAARMVMGGFTALAAGWKPGGVVLALVAAGLTVLAVVRWRSVGPRAIGALAALVAFCVTTALTRVDIVPPIAPDEIRYRWAVATYLVLAVVSAWPPRRAAVEPTDTSGPGPVWIAGAAVAVLLAIGGVRLVVAMHDWTDTAVAGKPGLRAVLFATETVGEAGGETVLPLSYVPVTAAAYLGAVDDVGSPLDGTMLTSGGQPDQLSFADRYLVEQGTEIIPAAETRGEKVISAQCATAIPPGGVLAAGTTTLIVLAREAGGSFSIQRFGDEPIDVAIPAGGATIQLPHDRPGVGADRFPYRLSAPTGISMSACT